MKRLILPVLLALIGAGAGVGAGMALRPPDGGTGVPADPHSAAADPHAQTATAHGAGGREPSPESDAHASDATEFVKLNNQFVVPVLKNGQVTAMVVLSLTLETEPGSREAIYEIEPRIRDTFLQVMFAHANAGGFDGTFTQVSNLDDLRVALRETATRLLGEAVVDVLVTDIARQDI
ncbi:flagellar basal body-associated FliL family protein [Tropicimonas sp. IMCC34043]|uniref:flagellar basal body-associated FliL family protein n=1 Tax=Tropicimonas sp. IMCC34043 TaxID=2248760 RepID=UPI000E241BFE|nr:flagellar basal body-associated FliL family protein [Tropicimonas sp. IMCC34043]